MTCVACVNNYSGGWSKSKCVFRKCQSWGKAKLIRADSKATTDDGGDDKANNNDDGVNNEDEDDGHDADCFVCNTGGGRLLLSMFILLFTTSHNTLISISLNKLCLHCHIFATTKI